MSALPVDPLWPRAGDWPAPTGNPPAPAGDGSAPAEYSPPATAGSPVPTGRAPAPTDDGAPDAVLLGVPAWRTSLSPTGAGETPAAVRESLRRYSPTLVGPPPLDLNAALRIVDAGDVAAPRADDIHLDIDVDVCDRSVATGGPASVPGSLAAWELRALVRAIARDDPMTSADIVEVDATADTADARTVRLAALCVLKLLAGLAERQ